MKNVVKSSKHFFGYFNTLETHSEMNLDDISKHYWIGQWLNTKYSWLNTESISYFGIFFYLGKQRSDQNKQEINCSVISISSLADPMERTLDIFVVDHIERAPIRYREKKFSEGYCAQENLVLALKTNKFYKFKVYHKVICISQVL